MRAISAGWTISAIEFYLPALRRYARALTQDRDLADRLVRGCLEHAVPRVGHLPGDVDLRVWLFGLLHREHGEHARRPDQKHAGPPPVAGDHSESAEHRAFRVAFERLAVEDRQILLLTGLEGLTLEEAADVLGVCVAAARAREVQAREKLRSGQRELADLSPVAIAGRLGRRSGGVTDWSVL